MTLIDIPRLIDLALVTPETGILNLNILHKVLHAIASQINLKTTRIEFKENLINFDSTKITEFLVNDLNADDKEKWTKVDEDVESNGIEKVLVFENLKLENIRNKKLGTTTTTSTTNVSNPDDKENWAKVEDIESNEIEKNLKFENIRNKKLETTPTTNIEENFELTNFPDFNCLSEKVEKLRQNFCNLQKSFEGKYCKY